MPKCNTFEMYSNKKMKLLNQNTRVISSSLNGRNASILVIATTTTTLWGC
jgi:hypothetical protein